MQQHTRKRYNNRGCTEFPSETLVCFLFLSNLVSWYLYIVLLLVCFHSLTSFIFRFSLIYYERPSSIFSRNKSGPSSSKSTATRVPLYKLTSIIIPLVHPVLVRFAFSSHSPRFVWIRLRDFPFLGLLQLCMHTISRLRNPLPQLTTFECRLYRCTL